MQESAPPRHSVPAGVKAFAALGLAPLLVLVLARTPPPEDYLWDGLMLTGFVAAGGIALLPLASGRRVFRFGSSLDDLLAGFRFHRLISYVLLLLVLAHTIGLLVYQPNTLEYLKLSAPDYMLAGLLAVVLLVFLLVHAERAGRRMRRYGNWRASHRWLSIGVIFLTAYHVAGSGFYLGSWTAAAALITVCALPMLATFAVPLLVPRSKSGGPPIRSVWWWIGGVVGCWLLVAFLLLFGRSS